VISLDWARYIAADEANLLSQLPARNGLGQPLSIPRFIPTAEATSRLLKNPENV
jgi:hypothetical protein